VRFVRRVLRDVVARALFHPVIDVRGAGIEHVEAAERPFLIASNHLSILDGLPILYALPARLRARVAPTAMWEHFRRGRRWQYVLAVAGLDMIPLVQVGDWRATLRVAGIVCDRGGCPLVFPEGARSDDGELLPFHPGVAVMARELHLPVVPCALMGTLAVMPRGAKWFHRCWTRRAPVAVRFGAAMEPPRPDDDPRAVVEELARRIEILRREALAAAGCP
jgi:long-chain acyl-CoA synthetase